MEITAEQQKFIDEVTEAGMTLEDLRAFRKDREQGDTITPQEWMKAKDQPEVDRERSKNTRISEANKKAGLDEYLSDKFNPPSKDHPEHPLSPSSHSLFL